MDDKQVHEKMFNVIIHQGNVNLKPQRHITIHPLNELKLKRLTIADAREDLEKLK